jgi:hypothetical protein
LPCRTLSVLGAARLEALARLVAASVVLAGIVA